MDKTAKIHKSIGIYRVGQKSAPFLYALTLSNIYTFSKLLQEKNCNSTITANFSHFKCVATLPCKMSVF